MMRKILKYIVLSIGLTSCITEVFAKPVIQQNRKVTYLDSLVFDYENSIWGKNPAVPLKPLRKENNSTLPDLKDYGISDDKPILSTERTIFVDSTYKVKLNPVSPRGIQAEKDMHHQHIGLGLTIGGTAMSYGSDFGSGKLGFSPGFHINYEYYLNRNWGFMLGLDMNFTTGRFLGKNYKDSYELTDPEGDYVKFSYSVGSIEEQNRLAMLNFPICIAFAPEKFYAHGGLKIGVPVSIKYKQNLSDFDLSCYIPEYNTTIPNCEALGLGDRICNFDGKFSSSPIVLLLTLDGGYRFKVNKQFDVMCGVFFDKALYRLKFKASQDQNNEQYNPKAKLYDFLKSGYREKFSDNNTESPAYLIHSSVLTGKQITTGERIATGIGYTSFGIRVSVCYNSYGKDYFPKKDSDDDKIPDVDK